MYIRFIALMLVVGASSVSSAAAQSGWLYANDAREVFQVDPITGATTSIGRHPFGGAAVFTDIAVTPDGTIYLISADSLMQLDTTTGMAFKVGSLNVPGVGTALVSDRLGRLFGAAEDGTFFEVNPTTGQARIIGSFGSHLPEGDLAFGPDGTLFATSSVNRLLRIDLATGAATVVGEIGHKQLEGLAFDADGRLYVSTVGASFLTLDPTTAEAVPAGTFNNGRHMDGLATTPTPYLQSITSGLSLTLGWQSVGSALSYVLEAGSSRGLKDLYNADIGSVTTLTASASAGTYFVRLRARTAKGMGPPSNEVQVILGDPSCTTPAAPTGFTGEVVRQVLTLQWNPTPGASSYLLEAGTAPGLSDLYVGNIGSQTTIQFNMATLPRILYYLRLRAVAGCGAISIPSGFELNRR